MDMRIRQVKNMQAVVFDMDGVLFDTERLCGGCWLELADEQGIDRELMQRSILACVGRNANDCAKVVAEIMGADFPYEEYRRQVSACMLEAMERDGIPIKPGVYEILEWLKTHGYRIAMASSSSERSVRHHLEQAGILEYFDTITSGDMVEHSKPSPDIYLKACASIGQKPGVCYAVEDSPNGIRSAYSAGMKVIMVPDLQQPDEEIQRKICAKCNSLQDVIDWLEREKEKDDSHCHM